ncbi:MAG: hypothetical protein N2444_02050, partial [Methylocystis sp.]|nr:hypothetical protein [Methylocystis sp.]
MASGRSKDCADRNIDKTDGREERRPLASRDTAFAHRLTQLLLRMPVTPNQISLASVGFAALG